MLHYDYPTLALSSRHCKSRSIGVTFSTTILLWIRVVFTSQIFVCMYVVSQYIIIIMRYIYNRFFNRLMARKWKSLYTVQIHAHAILLLHCSAHKPFIHHIAIFIVYKILFFFIRFLRFKKRIILNLIITYL